jgi:hypothetical protein
MTFRLCQQAVEKLRLCTIHRWNLTKWADDKIAAGCSKRPDISPAQPRRAETHRSAGKAAASCYFTRGGWDDPNCAQYSTHPALSAPRRALSRARAFQFPLPPFRGVAKAALNCAHRTSTVSPCAFCEQGGHLAAPSPSFGGRALREHGDRSSYPALFQHPASTLIR